jgi:hypothetical protein
MRGGRRTIRGVNYYSRYGSGWRPQPCAIVGEWNYTGSIDVHSWGLSIEEEAMIVAMHGRA